jgi:hypothetical protein
MTMTLIETKTLLSAAASIEFTSIPQTFTDLVIQFSGRTDRASNAVEVLKLEFNNSTTGYTYRELTGNGAAPDTSGGTGYRSGYVTAATATANTFGNSTLYIPNYTSSSAKSYSVDGTMENNATTSFLGIFANLWSETDAITSLKFVGLNAGNFQIGTMVSLYGITKGSDGIVTTS